MSDTEYQGSGNVKGKGLVAKIVSGKVESLTYYGTSFTATGSYKPDYSQTPENPDTPDTPIVPDEPGKVTTLEDGYYVIANSNHALTSQVHTGYTNSYSYSYSGFYGVDVTISNNKITAGATSDMVFEVKASGTGYTIKHVDSGKYLTATYTQNSGNDGWTGTLTLGTTAEVWEWDSSTGYLKSTNASNNTAAKNMYLVFDDRDNSVSNGTQENLFGIRSSNNDNNANVDKIDFYAVTVTEEPNEPDAPHSHAYSTVVTAPTCTEDGYTTYTCSCGDTFTSNTVAALGHTWNDGVVTAPTCTEAGYTTYTCTVCDETSTGNSVNAKGHTEETVPGKAATCTETGLTNGTKCSVCGITLTEQTTIAALGHTEVTDAAVAATCTTTGKTEGKHCSVCNTVLLAQTDIAALGHTEVTDAAVAATCTEKGKTEGKHCSCWNLKVLTVSKLFFRFE